MQDFFPKGTGNSRYLKSSIAADTTLEQLITMLRNGTFPFDFNGINADGVAQVGTPYNTANVLPANVLSLLGLSSSAVLKDALELLGTERAGEYAKIGDIKATVRTDLGENWLLCNGNAVDAMEYPGLYNISQIIRKDSYNTTASSAYVSFAGDYKFYYVSNDSYLHWENLNTGETGPVRGANSGYLHRNICIGNGFTVGLNYSDYNIIYRAGADMSDQKTPWTTKVVSNGNVVNYILFGGGYFIACLSDYSLWYSTNPNNWTQITKPSGVTAFYNIKFTNNLFIICGVDGKIYYSNSITSPNWQEANTGIAGEIYTIEYYNGTWVAGGRIASSYYFGCISTASEIDGIWTPGSQLSGVVYDVSHLDIGVWIILAINQYSSAGYLYVYENDMQTVIDNTTSTSFNPNMNNTYYNKPSNLGVHTNSQYVVIVGNSNLYQNYTLNFSKLLPTISVDGAYAYIKAKE